MIELTLDMEQYDCPFIDASEEQDVSFTTVNWELDKTAGTLETRMVADAPDRESLDGGLTSLRKHEQILDYDMYAKRDGVAQIRSVIPTTDAMTAILHNDGYISGPFHIEDGSELWHIGFDGTGPAEDALSDLDRNNEYTIEAREELRLDDLQGFANNVGAAMSLVNGCKDLSDTERRTLEAAVNRGYFERPRNADLGTLADEFGVSKPAVSNNLRRGQERVLSRVVDALDQLDMN